MRFRGPSTRVVDRPGAFAIPGLIDAHGHMESFGAGKEEVDLRGVASLAEVARRIKARVDATPGDSWITGRNWDQSLWPGGAFPTAAVLDEAAPRRPVWLERVDGHAGWASSEAMRRAKVNKESKAPPDGQIIRGQDRAADRRVRRRGHEPGRPRGAGPDQARRPAPAARGPGDGPPRGLTGVHDAGISRRTADVYRELDHDGQLAIRVYGMALPPWAMRSRSSASRPRPAPTAPGSSCDHQALHRRRDGLARRALVQSLPRRPWQFRPAPDRSQGPRGRRRPRP